MALAPLSIQRPQAVQARADAPAGRQQSLLWLHKAGRGYWSRRKQRPPHSAPCYAKGEEEQQDSTSPI